MKRALSDISIDSIFDDLSDCIFSEGSETESTSSDNDSSVSNNKRNNHNRINVQPQNLPTKNLRSKNKCILNSAENNTIYCPNENSSNREVTSTNPIVDLTHFTFSDNEIDSDESDLESIIFDSDNTENNVETQQFIEEVNITNCPARNSPPICYFNLFFTNTLLQDFSICTNNYAMLCLQTNDDTSKICSRLMNWQTVTPREMMAFIAVILNMALRKQPSLYSYWITKSSQYTPWFGKMFKRERFEALLSYFLIIDPYNLQDPRDSVSDPLSRFQVLIDHFNKQYKKYFTSRKTLYYNKLTKRTEYKTEKQYSTRTSFKIINNRTSQIIHSKGPLKVWKKIVFEIFDVMILHAYFIYKKNCDKPLNRYNFQVSIIDDLSRDWIDKINPLSTSGSVPDDNEILHSVFVTGQARGKQFLEKIPNQKVKNCCECNKPQFLKKRTSYHCTKCKKGLHPLCFRKHYSCVA